MMNYVALILGAFAVVSIILLIVSFKEASSLRVLAIFCLLLCGAGTLYSVVSYHEYTITGVVLEKVSTDRGMYFVIDHAAYRISSISDFVAVNTNSTTTLYCSEVWGKSNQMCGLSP